MNVAQRSFSWRRSRIIVEDKLNSVNLFMLFKGFLKMNTRMLPGYAKRKRSKGANIRGNLPAAAIIRTLKHFPRPHKFWGCR